MGRYRPRIRARRRVGRVLAATGAVVGFALASPSPTAADTPATAVESSSAAGMAAEPRREQPMPETDGDVTPLAVAIVGLAGYAVIDLAPRPRTRRRSSS